LHVVKTAGHIKLYAHSANPEITKNMDSETNFTTTHSVTGKSPG
jgi:hypothetical protein